MESVDANDYRTTTTHAASSNRRAEITCLIGPLANKVWRDLPHNITQTAESVR